MSLTIGITHCDEWANYERWLKGFDPSLNIIRLKAGESSIEQVKQCDGIILSGGEDVHPSLYNKPEYMEKYNLKDFNRERDEFEFAVLKEITKSNTPLLGICRGLQVTNVFFKGTLVPDLPSFQKAGHSNGKKDTEHNVEVDKQSKLFSLTKELNGTINSHHHQAADKIGEGLKANATADGVIEGIEKADANNHNFFMLVQWHPERMDASNPFSGRLREGFIKACIKQTVTT
jgi:putative glutamine amidotransferase